MKNLINNSITIIVATIVGLILCEITLRVAGISYPVFTIHDENRGHASRPYKEGWKSGEGAAYIKINSLGYRDVEHSIEKSLQTFRIAVLGDSFAEATQVAQKDTFWSYMGQHLNTCSALVNKKVEVLNFGVGAYSTTQEFLTLQHHVWQFSPDMVLLTVTALNDIADNSKKLSTWNQLRPFHVLKNDKLVLDNSFHNLTINLFWKHFFREISQYSRLVELVIYLKKLNLYRKLWMRTDIPLEISLSNKILSSPKNVVLEEAWLITEKLFSKINKEVSEHNAIFVLAVLTVPAQVYPDPTMREKIKRNMGVDDLFYPERRIRSIGEKYGFPVITMAERLQQIATQKHIFLHGFKNTRMGFGHWNENGHRQAGEIIVKDICTKILLSAL
jgi:hypothetical protein